MLTKTRWDKDHVDLKLELETLMDEFCEKGHNWNAQGTCYEMATEIKRLRAEAAAATHPDKIKEGLNYIAGYKAGKKAATENVQTCRNTIPQELFEQFAEACRVANGGKEATDHYLAGRKDGFNEGLDVAAEKVKEMRNA